MRAKSKDWISVHYEHSKEEFSKSKTQGVTVRFMVSPLDIPEVWRYDISKYDGEKQVLVVEFKYLTASESKRFIMKDGIKIEIGKNSKRIYSITLPLPVDTEDSVKSPIKLTIEMAIDEIQAWEDEGVLRPAHADVIQEMLRQQKSYGYDVDEVTA